MFTPDPLSLWWEAAARRALQVAYGHPGRYYATVLAGPTARQRAAADRLDIDIDGKDTAKARKARTRWARAFCRALERINKREFTDSIEWNVGPALGTGRAIRIRTLPAGKKRKPLAKPDSQRIYTEDGGQGGRWADPVLRDWPAA